MLDNVARWSYSLTCEGRKTKGDSPMDELFLSVLGSILFVAILLLGIKHGLDKEIEEIKKGVPPDEDNDTNSK